VEPPCLRRGDLAPASAVRACRHRTRLPSGYTRLEKPRRDPVAALAVDRLVGSSIVSALRLAGHRARWPAGQCLTVPSIRTWPARLLDHGQVMVLASSVATAPESLTISVRTGQSRGCAGGPVFRKVGSIDWEPDRVR